MPGDDTGALGRVTGINNRLHPKGIPEFTGQTFEFSRVHF